MVSFAAVSPLFVRRGLSLRRLVYLALFWFAAGVLSASAQSVTFENPAILPTEFDPTRIKAADLNRDGNLDLVYLDGVEKAAHVLLGNGDGTFTHGQDLVLPNGPCGPVNCALVIADVSGDGIPDLILTGGHVLSADTAEPQVAVLLGNGDGTFQHPVVSTFQPTNTFYSLLSSSVAVGDVNGDGAADLVVHDASNAELYVLLGNNTGSFSLANSIQTYAPGSVYLVDLNGDGHLDILEFYNIGAIFYVFLGNGDGTFRTGVSYPTGAPTGNMVLTDLDGDGHLDVVADTYPGQIVWVEGNADGTFQAPATLLTGLAARAGFAAIGDYNSDGIKDLFFFTPAGIGIMLGQTGLTYGPMHQALSGNASGVAGPSVFTMAQGDFNKDGFTDIAMTVEGGIVLLFGNGDGTFKSGELYDLGQQVGAVAVADFTGDKLPDIAVTVPATFPLLLLGNGKGSFSLGADQNTSYGTQSPFTNIVVGDFKGDGNKDVSDGDQEPYVASTGNQFVEFGLGNGTFMNPIEIPSGSSVLDDFNNDGRTDTISLDGDSIAVSLGQEDGSFLVVTTLLRLYAGPFGIGDVNNDGKLDLVINYRDHLEVWLGKGDGTFTYSASIYATDFENTGPPTIADLDGDGNADILLVQGVAPVSITVLYGDGNGTFAAPALLPVSRSYSQVVVADVNRDNKPDLVLSDGLGISIILNEGGRSFGPEQHFIAGQNISNVAVADVNGDGYPDIVAANPGGTTVAVLLNEPNGTPLEGAASNVAFTASPQPSAYGQPIALQMTVSAPSAVSPVPTGSVSFAADGSFLSNVPLVAGIATYNLAAAFTPGTHALTATYDGDKNYSPQSLSIDHTVNPPVYVTTTTLVVAPTAILTSQTVRLAATVASSPQPPTGVLTFLDGSDTIAAVTIDASGVALFDTAELAAGTHAITARFEGYNQPSATGTGFSYTVAIYTASTSTPVMVNVAATGTIISLTSSSTSALAGTVVTFTAGVASTVGVPFGGVSFYDGNLLLGTSALASTGAATFSITSLAIGSHSVVATFNSNATFAQSTSNSVSVSVVAPPAGISPTVVSLTAASSASGQTLVATVASLRGTPNGSVTFLDGGQILGQGTTDASGQATLKLALSNSGAMHSMYASFGGSPRFAPSSSPELAEQWPAAEPDFSLGVAVQTALANGITVIGVNVALAAGFSGSIQLSCSNLPARYSCVFKPPSLAAGGKSELTIRRTNNDFVDLARSPSGFAVLFGGFLLLLMLPPALRARKCRPVQAGVLALAMAGYCVLTGCAGPSLSGESPQMLVVSVQASSTGPSQTILHSAQVAIRTVGLD